VHLKKVEERGRLARELLFPQQVSRGMIADPKERLRQLILKVGGRELLGLPPDYPLRTSIENLERFLREDVPELIAAVADAQNAARQARLDLAARAGSRYTVTLSSDAPVAVTMREVVPPPAE
jgi:hypothetical protein